ncbi:phosphatase [Echinicola pacifica]|uniref:Phosphatase n=1 Tax=Echinicola pacifica TaxID=346377 RepID=A0A918UQZ3_9BACT|nr:phosphatase domain-containing protein [Echinicola pacifica]GGZ27344.1 phosphatase [Echinicola pacifica]
MIIRLLTFPFRYAISKIKKWLGNLDKIKVEPLYAFGNEECIFVKARVVEAYRQSRPSEKNNRFQNVLAALRRYAGSSVPDARVTVTCAGQQHVLESDEEGIVSGKFRAPMGKKLHADSVIFKLQEEEGLVREHKEEEIPVCQFSKNHPTGIISDIDDTVLVSHATEIGKKLWLSVSKNAYTRRPFPGVSKFYHALTNAGEHPIFYVSSSDWNLFDMIKDFMDFRNIPSGPLLLQDLHLNLKNIWKSGGGNHEHKLEKVRMLLAIYPGMNFFLIGDSGQHDPELYEQVIKEHPGRVKTVYIRKVKHEITEERMEMVHNLKEIPNSPEVIFVKDTEEALKHALEHSFIVQ